MVEQAERPGEHDSGSYRLTFECWARDGAGAVGDVRGAYSRAAWPPVTGPSAWLVWGAAADLLRYHGRADCSITELGDPWAYDPEDVSWGLLQLVRYGLALPGGDACWRICTACPPLPDRLVPTAPSSVRAMHHRRLRPPGWSTPRGLRWGSEALNYGALVLHGKLAGSTPRPANVPRGLRGAP
jgi:hypothetical protein